MITKNAEVMFDAGMRIETIIWIPGAVADLEATPRGFQSEFCESSSLETEGSSVLNSLPMLARFAAGEDYPDPEDVASALLGVDGFLVQAATPVRRYHSETSATLSWGHYHAEWLYAPSEAEIATVCVAWAHSMHEADKKECGFGTAIAVLPLEEME